MASTEARRGEGLGFSGTVVGVGASAGGLEALENLFSALPPAVDFAFVVVQHLSPDHRSMMAELLTRRTQMRVVPAKHGEPLQANTVYLNSPGKLLSLVDGRFFVSELPPGHRVLPIDHFFTSLATAQGEDCVAVVLSGTGSDGARGSVEVRRQGGRVVVQSPESASFDGMPRACLAGGKPDFCGTAEAIAEYLVSSASRDWARDARLREFSDATLSAIVMEVARESGIDFAQYRKNSLRRRIERRVLRFELTTGEEYLSLLRATPDEARALSEEFLIGVTSFFRDPEAYAELERHVVRPLVENAAPDTELRLWSVACSTGEEPYSLALMIAHLLEETGKNLEVKIFASDVNAKAIHVASRGIYPESVLKDIPQPYRDLLPPPVEGHVTIPPKVRSMVVFAAHNIAVDPPFAQIDLLVCRNLLIYFEPQLQVRALDVFAFSVRPGGALFLGSSESVGAQSNVFEALPTHARLFRCQQYTKRSPLVETQGRRGPLTAFSRSSLNARMLELLTEVLAARVGPAGVAVGANMEPVHFFGDVTPYLSVARGAPSLNLLKLARAGFGATLAAAVGRARQSGKEFSYLSNIEDGGTTRAVKLTIVPVAGAASAISVTLIFFDEVDGSSRTVAVPDVEELSAQARSRDLEQELIHTRESLQGIVEELEVSNEELQSTNEELLSSNEELQSTNEELQAVNEELYTVNAEYVAKLRELDQLNNDLSNVLDSADIALVLLDSNLLLRRFTALAGHMLGIRSSDLGRSLDELALGGAGAALVECAREVVAGEQERVCRVSVQQHAYQAKINPYRNSSRAADGAVIVLTH